MSLVGQSTNYGILLDFLVNEALQEQRWFYFPEKILSSTLWQNIEKSSLYYKHEQKLFSNVVKMWPFEWHLFFDCDLDIPLMERDQDSIQLMIKYKSFIF